jgi:hypothetical protein
VLLLAPNHWAGACLGLFGLEMAGLQVTMLILLLVGAEFEQG